MSGQVLNRDFIIDAARIDEEALRWASEEIRNDASVVVSIVRHNWRAILRASEDVKREPKVLNACLANHPKRKYWRPSWIPKRQWIQHYMKR